MRIAWFCIPAHGHTNPTLKVVNELVASGHEIYYFSFDTFKEKIEKTGAFYISCDACGFDMKDKENTDRVGKDLAFATELIVNSTLSLDKMLGEKIEEIKPELIVFDSVAYWGKLCAKKYGIPYICSTTTFAFNRYSSRYMKQNLFYLFKMFFDMPKINKQIKRLKDKGFPVKGVLDIISNDNDAKTIVYTSKYFQPCADTFSDKYHFIGPSIREIEKPMEKTGQKTVYVSLGTVVKNENFYHDCIEAFKGSDYHLIVSLGNNETNFGDLPENIEIHKSVDQMAVLSVADAFITHCGMNSVSEALYFEVPLILYPQTPEQEAVARRTEELKAGIRLNYSEKKDIFSAVNKLFENEEYKKSAVLISKSFKECRGTKEAKEFIEGKI